MGRSVNLVVHSSLLWWDLTDFQVCNIFYELRLMTQVSWLPCSTAERMLDEVVLLKYIVC